MSKSSGRREPTTRWRRFAAAPGVSGALAAAMVFFTASGLLAASFSISGLPFTVTAFAWNNSHKPGQNPA